MFRSPRPLNVDDRVTLKIEIPDGGGWVFADAQIVRTAPSKRDETTRCLARITPNSPAYQATLSRFVKTAESKRPRTVEAKPIPLHEPTIVMSDDGRNLTARWEDPRAFRRDWAFHLSRGRLPATGSPPRRRAFMMRLMTPDGFVTTFPAEIGEHLKDGWTIRFLIPHDVFDRMRRYAERKTRKVV